MPQQEIKNCQNCQKDFVIEPDDFAFYEKIKAPSPTWCPECRTMRRFIFRNERNLYKRRCDLCGQQIITIYSPDNPRKVYCYSCYHSDKWDPLIYGKDIDFSRPFLEQLKELQLKVPRLYAFVFSNINSEYVNGAAFNKNCYLVFVSDHNEDSLFSYSLYDCRNTLDCLNSNECEFCYESVTCKKCNQVFYSIDCSGSYNLYFCKNCSNCHDCFASTNLRNAQYNIFNQQYSKEDYLIKLQEILGSHQNLMDAKNKAQQFFLKFPVKYAQTRYNSNVLGDYTFNSKNSSYVYDSEDLEDCKFMIHGNRTQSCYDGYVVVDNSQFSCETVSAIGLNNVKFSYCAWKNYNTEYSDTCENSNNLFGCVGLKKKQFCILNKQCTKEEYEALVPRIIQHMNEMPYIDKKGRAYKYGEFFPPELSPFAYNETIAQEYFPLTKEQALEQGYKWKDPEPRNYQIDLTTEQLPDHIKDVSDSIIGKVIECQHKGQCNEQCTEAFKIIEPELAFYRKMNLPLPRYCPNCRHYQRLKQRNPLKLWTRQCLCKGQAPTLTNNYTNTCQHEHGDKPCPNTFETSYAPDRPEIVYCETCYLKEVA